MRKVSLKEMVSIHLQITWNFMVYNLCMLHTPMQPNGLLRMRFNLYCDITNTCFTWKHLFIINCSSVHVFIYILKYFKLKASDLILLPKPSRVELEMTLIVSQKKCTPPSPTSVLGKLHLTMKVHSWSFGNCGVPLCHYSQVYCNPEWLG